MQRHRLAVSLGIIITFCGGLAVVAQQGAPSSQEIAERKSRFARIPTDITFPDVEKILAEQQAQQAEAEQGTQVAWSKYLTPELIKQELALRATGTQDALKNVNIYKTRATDPTIKADMHYALMAAMLQIAAEYDGQLPWKAEATGVRDMAYEAATMAAIAPDEDSFELSKKTTAAVETLVGSGKSGVEPADARKSWADEVADFNAIMKRMELAQFDKLRGWTNSQNDFVANKEMVIHEAAVLATIAQIILDKSYPLAEEGDYRKFAEQLRDNSLAIAEAARNDDFDTASSLHRDSNLACAGCHGAYR